MTKDQMASFTKVTHTVSIVIFCHLFISFSKIYSVPGQRRSDYSRPEVNYVARCRRTACFYMLYYHFTNTYLPVERFIIMSVLSNYKNNYEKKYSISVYPPLIRWRSFSEPTIFVVVWSNCSQQAYILKYLINLCSNTEPLRVPG